MGTITKLVQQRMKRFRQKQTKIDELTQPGCEDAADYFCQRDRMYSRSQLRVPVVVQPQMDDKVLAPPPRTFGEHMKCLDIVPRIVRMPQGTSRPGSSHVGLSAVKPQSKSSLRSGEPATEPDSSTLLKAAPVEQVSFYPCV
jgi:hypothetical protein